MAKFNRFSRLPPKEFEELMIYFCQALSSLKNTKEAAKFLADLLSAPEAEMLAKRLKIAKRLAEGKKYDEIRRELKVGFSTIARVNIWLNLSGEGFRMVIERTPEIKEKKIDPQEMYNLYSRRNVLQRAHWPIYIIEELIEESDKKQRQKIFAILQSMEDKSELFKDINKQLYEQFGESRKLDREEGSRNTTKNVKSRKNRPRNSKRYPKL
jgi:TrpR-related protein YerC/YecD